jgi:hypothetical protein
MQTNTTGPTAVGVDREELDRHIAEMVELQVIHANPGYRLALKPVSASRHLSDTTTTQEVSK